MNDGEVFGFLDNCYSLVDASVARHVERGFTNLMVCFGCTGVMDSIVPCSVLSQPWPNIYLRNSTSRSSLCTASRTSTRLCRQRVGNSLMKAVVLPQAWAHALSFFTDRHPKALVEIGGEAMLGHVLLKIKAAGISK